MFMRSFLGSEARQIPLLDWLTKKVPHGLGDLDVGLCDAPGRDAN